MHKKPYRHIGKTENTILRLFYRICLQSSSFAFRIQISPILSSIIGANYPDILIIRPETLKKEHKKAPPTARLRQVNVMCTGICLPDVYNFLAQLQKFCAKKLSQRPIRWLPVEEGSDHSLLLYNRNFAFSSPWI